MMYFLSPQTYACFVDDQLVFLDLARDAYYCLDPDDSAQVGALLAGRHSSAEAPSPAPDVDGNQAALSGLLEKGLLTQEREHGKELAPLSRSALNADFMGFFVGRRVRIRAHHLLRFVASSAVVAARLRWWPLAASIGSIHGRKQRHRETTRADQLTLDRVRGLVDVFKHLRPLMFSARNRCLYDSLVLTEFLLAYGCLASCVIGVKMGPFEAHCWVEYKSVVCNESVARALAFTPIMAV